MDYFNFNYNQIQPLPSTYYGMPQSATIDAAVANTLNAIAMSSATSSPVATVPPPPPKPKAETKPDEPSEPRFVKPATPQNKTTPFPWMPVLLGTGAVTVMGVGIYALANRNKAAEVTNKTINEVAKVIEQNPSVMEAMHNVFANATDFLPYQVNVLDPSQLPKRKTLLNTIGSLFSKPNVVNETPNAISYLEAVKKLKTADNLYLGDLHGAWQKLLQHLSMAELIQMPEATAKKFVSLHQELETAYGANAGLEDINQLVHEFKQALSQVKIIDDGRGIHLIGDIVGDRGHNDMLTLLLLDHCKAKIKSRVFSNHDLAAIEAYQRALYDSSIDIAIEGGGQIHSASRAFKLAQSTVANPAVTLSELRDLYDKHFKQLKLIHYDEQTETLSLHQAFNPERVPQILAAYIADDTEQTNIADALKNGDKQAYIQAVDLLNQGFQKSLTEKWLQGDNASIKEQLHDFYSAIWYGDTNARREFAQQALKEDDDFPFYNPKAVKNIAFGHSGHDEPPVAQGNFAHGSPWFYLLDQLACKPKIDKEWQFSRVFSPSLVNQTPFSTIA